MSNGFPALESNWKCTVIPRFAKQASAHRAAPRIHAERVILESRHAALRHARVGGLSSSGKQSRVCPLRVGQKALATRLRTGEAAEFSQRVRDPQGDYRWFLSRAEPLQASDGTLLSGGG
jgi:hypothetical protein